MAKFAAETKVSVETSKIEIERTLTRYGADSFMSGWHENQAFIQFRIAERFVRFKMMLPDRRDQAFTHYLRAGVPTERVATAAAGLWEQACRQKWRALALVIKAKLEAVDAGISIIEDEFLAHIVTVNGQTVAERIRDDLALEYKSGAVQPLMLSHNPA